MTTRIAAVIVNWRTPAMTIRCVESLLDQSDIAMHVIVVDNGSGDDSVSLLRAYRGPITIIALPENRGFAAGCNAGIRNAVDAGAELVWILNSDTVARPGCAAALVSAAVSQRRAVTVPSIYYDDGSERYWYAGGHFDERKAEVVHWAWGRTTASGAPNVKLSFATGCSVMLPVEAFESVGLFDERFFLYWEDVDYSRRLLAAGYEIVHVPAARVDHTVGASSGEHCGISETSSYYCARNRLWFLRLQPFRASVRAYLWTAPLFARDARRILQDRSHPRLRRWWALCRGTYQGMVARVPAKVLLERGER